jgi:hypothetical protein
VHRRGMEDLAAVGARFAFLEACVPVAEFLRPPLVVRRPTFFVGLVVGG